MRISGIKQTVFIDKEGRNKVLVLFHEDIVTSNSYLTVHVNGKMVCDRQKFVTSPCELLLPEAAEPADCRLELFDDLGQVQVFRCRLMPVKKWTVSFMTSSHEDLGYCEYVNKMEEGCADFLDAAMDIMDSDKRYKYVIEHYWWLKAFENCRDEAQFRRLKDYFDSGHIGLATPHCGTHTHWQGYEELPRSTYYARIYARERWGIDPKTAVYADLSGVTWSAVSAYRGAGIRYLLSLPNDFRDSKDHVKLPQCFWWVAPNGKDRLLVWTQRHYMQDDLRQVIHDTSWYYESDEFRAEPRQGNIERTIDGLVEQLGEVPYDLLPVSYYYDRRKPSTVLLQVIDAMQSKWQYPVFEMGLPDAFMGYIEDQFGSQLPEFSGDITDQWADFATIAPRWFAAKRNAEAMFGTAEALSTVRCLTGQKEEYPKAELDEAMWKMHEFDDHCWATSIKDPVIMHKYNLKLIKEQTALRAEANVKQVIVQSLGADGEGVYIWNPLPYEQEVMVKLPLDVLEGKVPADVEYQQLEDAVLTAPLKLPAFGARPLATEAAVSGEEACFARIGHNRIDTGFYTVLLDGDSGKIRNIVDNVSGQKLLDEYTPYQLGDFIYITTREKMSNAETHVDVHINTSYSILTGPLAVSLVAEGYEEQSGALIRNTITFYKHEKNIDVHFAFSRAQCLTGDFYDRYKKNIFFAFPFHVPHYKFYTELAGGVVCEAQDRLAIHTNDYVIPQNWVAAEGDEGGVALFTKEMPVFHLGGIHYNRFSSRQAWESSSIFLYAASNRTNQLNYSTLEDCSGEYHLSILPYEGSWKDCVPQWNLKKLYPPLAGAGAVAREQSMITVDQANVRLLTLKPAEDRNGLIIRFMELSGAQTTASVTLPVEVEEAVYTNIVEENTDRRAQTEGNRVTFTVEPYSYATLRLKAGQVEQLNYGRKDSSELLNIFTMPTPRGGTIISWEKRDHRQFAGFDIMADGKLALSVLNEALTIQWAELDMDPDHIFTIEGKPVSS
ncbi:MAG: hypothetical protein K0R57_6344 [Paenibacillaceae bacterium]|nr:hypothetical protein [Paenibacillaceae bacterium]